jgi:DNA-binding SARP family transcriptional activator
LPEQLEIAAHAITAILATWLGLTVTLRARRLPAARVFGLIALFLVTWSLAIIIERLAAPDADLVRRVANGFEEMGAFLVIAATPHIAVAISVEGEWSRLQRVTVVGGYVFSIALGLPSAVDPDFKFAITPPHFELPGIPGEVFGWAWVVTRVMMFGLAIMWLVLALRHADRDVARRRQLQVALVTVALGALGGIVRFTPPISDTDPWIGVSLVTLAVVVAAYAVFAQQIFFSADVAARTFRYSLVAGLVVTGYVAVVVGLDRIVRQVTGVEFPLVMPLALVATIALFEPISERVRHWLAGRTRREVAYERLLRALGEPLLLSHGDEDSAQPALARLVRTFRLTGAYELDESGKRTSSQGHVDEGSGVALRLPLRANGRSYGTVVFGAKRSGLPHGPSEVKLLGLAASYLAEAKLVAETEREQVAALGRLSGQRRELASAGDELHAALSSGAEPAPDVGLFVYALGALRVERGSEPIRHWGGAKAGTRQAEAVFAFLLDRGERGAAKDEFLELIWPDVDLDRADLAFHRTLGGLRGTLEPARHGGNRGSAITFHNDRYRLDPGLVAWCDFVAFGDEMDAASAAGDPDESLRHLERARSLYRGDYLDDCPFYGDSSQVEDRRALLRGRFIDLLLVLGERYETRGDRPAAAACYRQARQVNGETLPPADAALIRLGVPS